MECKNCLFSEDNLPDIQLNEEGICMMCTINLQRISAIPQQKNTFKLSEKVKKIKRSKRSEYDCLIGISGGVDSSYLVYLAKKWGLNPLLLHVDGGWNSDISVQNIKKLVDISGFDFESVVLPWSEMKDTQKAFIKADVLDIDLPFDNAMLSYNYLIARKYKIKYILNGFSTATEGIMPDNFTHYKFDKKNILDIQKKYGNHTLKKLKFIGTFNYLWYSRFYKIKFLQPLDWIDYNKIEATEIIQQEYDWQDYGGKHYENIFTRFYQGHILPKKYKIDKRISHFSMLICNGELTKSEALIELKNSRLYPTDEMEQQDKEYFCKKLDLSNEVFTHFMNLKGRSHRDFKSDLDLYDSLKPLYQKFKQKFKFDLF